MSGRQPTEAEIKAALDAMQRRAQATPYGAIGGRISIPNERQPNPDPHGAGGNNGD
jgi:hypothetical protein